MLINGSIINGAAINGASESELGLVASLQSRQFGKATTRASLATTRFGVPKVGDFFVASLQTARFGGSNEYPVVSLKPSRFGAVYAVTGMAPGATSVRVSSLRGAAFGTPAVSASLSVGPPVSVQSVRFGAPTLGQHFHAAELRPSRFGEPSLSMGLRAQSLCHSRFGVPRVSQTVHAQSLGSVRFGVPSRRSGSVDGLLVSLRTVQFGTPRLSGIGVHVRPLCASRFGVPVLDRGSAC